MSRDIGSWISSGWVETEHMALYGNRQVTERVADLLLQLQADNADEPLTDGDKP